MPLRWDPHIQVAEESDQKGPLGDLFERPFKEFVFLEFLPENRIGHWPQDLRGPEKERAFLVAKAQGGGSGSAKCFPASMESWCRNLSSCHLLENDFKSGLAVLGELI